MAFNIIGGLFMSAVGVICPNASTHLVVDEFSAVTELVDGSAPAPNRVVFNFNERTISKRRLCQPIELVVFVIGRNRFQLSLRIRPLYRLTNTVTVVVVSKSPLVSQRVCNFR